MDQGVIVEEGTHQELMKTQGNTLLNVFISLVSNVTFYKYVFLKILMIHFTVNKPVLTGFYYKLVTTGNENITEAEAPDRLLEEPEEETNEDVIPMARVDVRRRSNRRVHRHHSLKKGSKCYLSLMI